METYKKTFAVENALITYEVWEHHQTTGWMARFGTSAPPAIFDVRGGIADVYYQDMVFGMFRDRIREEQKNHPEFFSKAMDQYEAELDTIHKIIAEGKPLPDVKTLVDFTEKFHDAWIGLDLSYTPDYIDIDASAERRSAAAREKAFGFYIGADRLIKQTLETLFPDLGPLTKYLLLEEITGGKLPDRSVLEARAKHFIYYKGKVLTDMMFEEFCKTETIRIESVYAPLRDHLRGLVGSAGKVSGIARILTSNTNRAEVKAGDIVVAADFPASDFAVIDRAAGLILDAGTYYSPVAIAARAAGKPCVFGTRIGTMVLQNGDPLTIDGDAGTIRVTEKT